MVRGMMNPTDEELNQIALNGMTKQILDLQAELSAYRRAYGPLVIGAEPVRCFACANRAPLVTALEAVFAWCRKHEEATPPMPVFHEYLGTAERWLVAIPRDGKITIEAFADPTAALIALGDALSKAVASSTP